jgi:hypothetical protein
VLLAAARALRLASIAACLVTIVSFALFAVAQTSNASAHQQSVLNGEAPGAGSAPSPSGSTQPAGSTASTTHEGSAHRTIDDVSNTLTSPFSGVTAGWSSQWLIRGVKVLLALALYGFGLGFVARAVGVRA